MLVHTFAFAACDDGCTECQWSDGAALPCKFGKCEEEYTQAPTGECYRKSK